MHDGALVLAAVPRSRGRRGYRTNRQLSDQRPAGPHRAVTRARRASTVRRNRRRGNRSRWSARQAAALPCGAVLPDPAPPPYLAPVLAGERGRLLPATTGMAPPQGSLSRRHLTAD